MNRLRAIDATVAGIVGLARRRSSI